MFSLFLTRDIFFRTCSVIPQVLWHRNSHAYPTLSLAYPSMQIHVERVQMQVVKTSQNLPQLITTALSGDPILPTRDSKQPHRSSFWSIGPYCTWKILAYCTLYLGAKTHCLKIYSSAFNFKFGKKRKEIQMTSPPVDLTGFISGIKSTRNLSTHENIELHGIYNDMESITCFKESSVWGASHL